MLGIVINQVPLTLAKQEEFSFKLCIAKIELRLSLKNILVASRKREYVTARIIAIYMVRKNTTLTLKEIGILFNRDHSTIIYNLEQYNDLYKTKDKYFMDCLKKVR